MGVQGLFSDLMMVFQTFALVWIGFLVIGLAILIRTLVKTRRDEEWIRSQDEVDRLIERTGLTDAKRDGEAAA